MRTITHKISNEAEGARNESAAVRPHELIDKRGVAAHAGVCSRTVDHWMASGLPHLKIGPRSVRFDLNEVRDWLRNNFRVSRMGKENMEK